MFLYFLCAIVGEALLLVYGLFLLRFSKFSWIMPGYFIFAFPLLCAFTNQFITDPFCFVISDTVIVVDDASSWVVEAEAAFT